MNKVAIIIVSLTLAMALGLGGCSPAAPAPTPRPLATLPEILDVTITGYHSTHDIWGSYDPHRMEATFSWETNKPCYYYFEVRPIDFDYPLNSGGYEKFDVSSPLQEQVEHSRPIVLKGTHGHHFYVLTVWDKEKNYITKSDTFWAPVIPKAPPPPPPAPKQGSED